MVFDIHQVIGEGICLGQERDSSIIVIFVRNIKEVQWLYRIPHLGLPQHGLGQEQITSCDYCGNAENTRIV